MTNKTKNLPYFNIKPNHKEKMVANFLFKKFKSKIKKKIPQHYLAQPIPFKKLEFIKKISKKYPYFLRFDIKIYYPSILPQILLEKLPFIYQEILEKPPSRRFKNCLKYEIREFLSKSPYKKGLPIGSRLSYILAGIFLLDLDIKVKDPFLRHNDDYLIFCRNKKDPEKLLKNIILPELKELGLELNEKKLKSGKFYQDKVNFIGFEFYSGYARISEDKVEEFKQRIKNLTYLTKKKTVGAVIKQLNNKILGFGHYYKIASCLNLFQDLDAFVRARLRRYIQRNKDKKDKQSNLILTNTLLQSMGLKSLSEIYKKYASKKKGIIGKKDKKKQKTGRSKEADLMIKHSLYIEKYGQKEILEELKRLTSLVGRVKKRIERIEKRLR